MVRLKEQDKLYWRDLPVATHIPELVVCPDHKQVFMFSAITWNRHHIHYNKDAAINEGLPDIVVQRALIGNFFARLITNWIGGNAELQKLTWKMIRSAFPGKDIVCRGEIMRKITLEGKKCLICKITASDKNNELIASGEATVLFV